MGIRKLAVPHLKVTWSLKNLIFLSDFPHQYLQDFFVTCIFKRLSLRLFRFKISQFVPYLHIFDRFCGFLIKKGTNSEIFNLNNQRLVRFKVHVVYN